MKLLQNGAETYSGAAGTIILVIELNANYSGDERNATITIVTVDGKDRIDVRITQSDKAKTGEVHRKLLRKITSSSNKFDFDYSQQHIEDISYDANKRISAITDNWGNNTSLHYENTSIATTTITTGFGGTCQDTATLNNDGFVSRYAGSSTYNDVKIYDLNVVYTYQNGYLQQWVETVKEMDVDEREVVVNLTWENGNLVHFDDNGNNFGDVKYGTVANKANIDFFWLYYGLSYFNYADLLLSQGFFGKNSANLVTRVGVDNVLWEVDSDGYPVTATMEGDNWSDVWLFEYYE